MEGNLLPLTSEIEQCHASTVYFKWLFLDLTLLGCHSHFCCHINKVQHYFLW